MTRGEDERIQEERSGRQRKRARGRRGEIEGEREWKGEGKKGMILSGVREREGVEGGRDGDMGRGIKRM